jgi:SAM-dependent methyltransferase
MDSGVWNESYLGDDVPQHPDPVLIAEVVGLTPGRALDLGCGAGGNAVYLATRGWHVTGVDYAPDGIRLAKELAERNGVAEMCEFIVADTTVWKPEPVYDLVICMFALPGGDHSPLTLATAREALAPNGTLIVLDFARDSLDDDAPSFFEPDELTTTDEIVAELPGLHVERARNIDVQYHYETEEGGDIAVEATRTGTSSETQEGHGHDSHASWPLGAFVRARRPR